LDYNLVGHPVIDKVTGKATFGMNTYESESKRGQVSESRAFGFSELKLYTFELPAIEEDLHFIMFFASNRFFHN